MANPSKIAIIIGIRFSDMQKFVSFNPIALNIAKTASKRGKVKAIEKGEKMSSYKVVSPKR